MSEEQRVSMGRMAYEALKRSPGLGDPQPWELLPLYYRDAYEDMAQVVRAAVLAEQAAMPRAERLAEQETRTRAAIRAVTTPALRSWPPARIDAATAIEDSIVAALKEWEAYR